MEGNKHPCGIDVRSTGGYVVMPPSIVAGVKYKWVKEGQLSSWPQAAQVFQAQRLKQRTETSRSTDTTIPEGRRNAELTSVAGTMRRRGLEVVEIEAALHAVNANRCAPPLSEHEVIEIARSVGRYPASDRSEVEESLNRQLKIVRASDVVVHEPRFLMPNYIVDGKLNLMFGMPGDGKSTIALDIAAALSNGGSLPDGSIAPKGRTLYISAEDSPSDTLVPRLLRQEADLDQIDFVDLPVMAQQGWLPSLHDVDLIESKAAELEARLIVIDPVFAFLGKTNVINNTEVRRVLSNLSDMADRTGIAVLGIGHPNKAQGGHILDRVSGSREFAAAARSILIAGRDSNDPAMRYFGSIKNSVGLEPPMLKYHFRSDGTLVWDGVADGVDPGDLMRSQSPEAAEQREDAAEAISELLSAGAMAANEVKRAVKQEVGCSDATVRRGQKSLGITRENGCVFRESDADGKPRWLWKLPDKSGQDAHVQDAQGEQHADEHLEISSSHQSQKNPIDQSKMLTSQTMSILPLPQGDSQPDQPNIVEREF